MREIEFQNWLRGAKSGEALIYHEGCLMADRQHPGRVQLDLVADCAWKAAIDGRVELYQKRIGKGCRYFAVKM